MATPRFDLAGATDAMAEIVSGIGADDLTAATPSPGVTVRDLLFHILGFSEAFRQGATKEGVGHSAPPRPAPDTALPDGWGELITTQLKALTEAWRDPAAWEGDTEVGGVTAPAVAMAGFALNEVVVHSWDLARATGRRVEPADKDVAVLLEKFRDTPREGIPGLFGPVVEVPADASEWERLLGLTGRDPYWRP
ncbi:TIGR03086 family protein [Nocardia nova]|uniref:TIGR03086 family protein n=1 Tax=Nocardia nova TaxID=37330 RepID=A0A2S6AE40_9NOCA|nr:TIGR03086 family metal-binding protein [Nocardia nova]PPJ19830.1 TIGR03086 family protein [Nocardia nova]PPJ32356.1 TIGR03086 family protein [Nocardia nova]